MNDQKDYGTILKVLERKIVEFNKNPSLEKYKSANNTIRELNHYMIEDVIENHSKNA